MRDIALIIAILLSSQSVAWAHQNGSIIPRQAAQYKATVIREVRYYWGLGESPATFMSQIHQESTFREDAKSAVGATGLAQVMPMTAQWLQQIYPKDLKELCDSKSGCPLNAHWAIRTLVIYDKKLFDRLTWAETKDDRWAATLSAYNGGESWVTRERRACSSQFPVASNNNVSDSHMRYAVSFSQRSISNLAAIGLAYLNDLIFSQLRSINISSAPNGFGMKSSSTSIPSGRSTFFISINNIIKISSDEQMVRPDARRIVAAMQDAKAIRNISDKPSIHQSVDKQTSVPIATVSIPINSPYPQPARISLADKGQNSLTERDSATRHNDNISCNRWFENLEKVCLRAKWACDENRHYPRNILYKWRHHYQ